MLLSRRESQVVELMSKGLSRGEISDRLEVSKKCVRVFIERPRCLVGGQLNTRSRGEICSDLQFKCE